MIHRLRKRHRRIWPLLTLLLGIGFALALTARPGPPGPGPAPGRAAVPDPAGLVDHPDLWRGARIDTRIGPAPGGGRRVLLEAPAPIAAPDLLVYWSRAEAEPGDALPDDARFLGAFGAGPAAVDLPAGTGAGRLLLHSLAHGLIVAVADLPAPAAAQAGSAPPEPETETETETEPNEG